MTEQEFYNEIGEHIFIVKCSQCGHVVEIKGCSTCKHRHTNYLNYDEAKNCHECDFFHKNYELED